MKALPQILDYLSRGGATAEEVADGTGLPPDSCRAHLSELVRSGLVAKDRKVPREIIRNVTLYRIAPTAQDTGAAG